MTAPAPVTRAVMLERDKHRCVQCGATVHLEAQHRRAVGMGGSKILPLIADLVTACAYCNEAFEASMHADALVFGWKVRGWVLLPQLVPVFFRPDRTWYELTVEGERRRLSSSRALEMMHDVYGDDYDDLRKMVA